MFGWGCTKMRSPEIGMVWHWRPPDLHIFDIDPSLISTKVQKTITKLILLFFFPNETFPSIIMLSS